MLSCSQICIDYIASRIILGIILEPLSWPKPGNVGPSKYYPDLKLEDFIASALILYPRLRTLILTSSLNKNHNFCYWLKNLVSLVSSVLNKNVILGTLILVIPIAMGVGRHCNEFCRDMRASINKLRSWSQESLVLSFSENANDFLEAIAISKASIPNYEGSAPSISKRQVITVEELIHACSKWDVVCYELSKGFELTTSLAEKIAKLVRRGLSLTRAIAQTYLEALTEIIDTHIVRRHSIVQALRTQLLALLVNKEHESNLLNVLDKELRRRRINPGTLADLIATATVLYLLSESENDITALHW